MLNKFEVKKDDGSRFDFKCEVDPESFFKLIASGTVYIGWDKCWVNEEFSLPRCFKCWNFHHISSDVNQNCNVLNVAMNKR